jgi:tripartite-type tricarboxylate transporter receptor subunit TctC
VPFRGDAPALVDVMAGQVTFMFYPMIGIADHVPAGKLGEEMRKSLARSEIRARLKMLGANTVGDTPAEFLAFLKEELRAPGARHPVRRSEGGVSLGRGKGKVKGFKGDFSFAFPLAPFTLSYWR